MGKCLVLLPKDVNQRVPNAVVHFVGGFIAGSAVQVAYVGLLDYLSARGYLIVATPIPPLEINHGLVSRDITSAFDTCYSEHLLPLLGGNARHVPIIGVAHSLGGKLQLLSAADVDKSSGSSGASPAKSANVFVSFNNYGAQESYQLGKEQAEAVSPELSKIFEAFQSAPVQQVVNIAKAQMKPGTFFDPEWLMRNVGSVRSSVGQAVTEAGDALGGSEGGAAVVQSLNRLGGAVGDAVGGAASAAQQFNFENVEFEPCPEETWRIASRGYRTRRNVVVRFSDDEIDQSLVLMHQLRKQGLGVELLECKGTHLTPNALSLQQSREGKKFFRELATALDSLVMQIESEPDRSFELPARAVDGGGAEAPLGSWDSDGF
jgi:hypothetical protein